MLRTRMLALGLVGILALVGFSRGQGDDKKDDKDKEGYNEIYVPTPQNAVEKMLDMAKVTKDDLVYDLGCGDGRICCMAARDFGAKSVGVDIDPARIDRVISP